GCLDIESGNFALDADEACLDCCTYPRLKINVLHQYSDTDTTFATLALNRPTEVLKDIDITVSNLKFYLQDFKLIRTNRDKVGVRDSVRVFLPNDTMTVEDNFLLVDRQFPRTYDVGDIRAEGSYDSLEFTFGLNTLIQNAIPSTFPSMHPLFLEAGSDMYRFTSPSDSTYLAALLEMNVQQSPSGFIPTTRRIDKNVAIELENGQHTATISVPFKVDLPRGFDIVIVLRIDYRKWLEQADLLQQPINVSALFEGIKTSFSVEEVRLD
ncbi:MAG: MbnP family protein, partial [Bacteroidota bacterium]